MMCLANLTAIDDLEAGVEHFGWDVETSVDYVLVAVEPSIDSLEVAERISELATQIQIADKLRDYLVEKEISIIGSIHRGPEIFGSCLEGRSIHGRVATEDVGRILDFLFP